MPWIRSTRASVASVCFLPRISRNSSALAADAARAFRPKILYPYHYGQTDVSQLVELLADEADIEVRVRSME